MENDINQLVQMSTKQEKVAGILVSDQNGLCISSSKIDPKIGGFSASILNRASKISKENVTIQIETSSK